jgi:hypothetical protein
MDDHTLDPERRKRQQEAFRKIVEAGQVPPVLPQQKTLIPQPKYPWAPTEKDRVLLTTIKISSE